ncbi:unnamed protein product [Colias eurytheme]|nr:unnamed protein product [Colias eurytheme]
MEWTMPVNDMLQDEITKLNYSLIPPGFKGDVRTVRLMQECLKKIIDNLGERSAKAQGLSKVITSTDRLRNSDHNLYLMKEALAKGGDGEVIGLLKVGYKHLYLFDDNCKSWEVEPLCILDFYVLEDRQRHGCGKRLFDHMLMDQGKRPDEFAIDGPSSRLESFLKKHFGTERLIRQTNNFAVTAKFFEGVKENKSGRSTPSVAGSQNIGRYAAPKPNSAIASVIHGGQKIGDSPEGATSDKTPSSEREHFAQIPEPVPEPEPIPVPGPAPLPNDIDENNHKNHERPSTLEVRRVSQSEADEVSPAGSTASRRLSSLTDRGYFDVKFYHNKLW